MLIHKYLNTRVLLKSVDYCASKNTHSLADDPSEQEDVEGVCGGAQTDLSSTPEFSDRLSQGQCFVSNYSM